MVTPHHSFDGKQDPVSAVGGQMVVQDRMMVLS